MNCHSPSSLILCCTTGCLRRTYMFFISCISWYSFWAVSIPPCYTSWGSRASGDPDPVLSLYFAGLFMVFFAGNLNIHKALMLILLVAQIGPSLFLLWNGLCCEIFGPQQTWNSMVRFSKFTKKKEIYGKFEKFFSKLVWRETLFTYIPSILHLTILLEYPIVFFIYENTRNIIKH